MFMCLIFVSSHLKDTIKKGEGGNILYVFMWINNKSVPCNRFFVVTKPFVIVVILNTRNKKTILTLSTLLSGMLIEDIYACSVV